MPSPERSSAVSRTCCTPWVGRSRTPARIHSGNRVSESVAVNTRNRGGEPATTTGTTESPEVSAGNSSLIREGSSSTLTPCPHTSNTPYGA
jgi:hypothetical protein